MEDRLMKDRIMADRLMEDRIMADKIMADRIIADKTRMPDRRKLVSRRELLITKEEPASSKNLADQAVELTKIGGKFPNAGRDCEDAHELFIRRTILIVN